VGQVVDSTVFVVVPVYERFARTQSCIEQLKAQTYPNIEIVIVDGGSRDGSVDALREIEGITLIADVGEQWWTGATWYGIDYALRHGGETDLVLLLNNDTTVPHDAVAVLAEEARAHCAAVEAVQVDESDHSKVFCAGATFDWSHYRSVALEPPMPSGGFDDRTEVLDGRATMVPLSILREVGNVRRRALPHYCADTELFFRIAHAGYPLAVTHRTWVATAPPPTIPFALGPVTFSQVWRSLWDRRSMSNLRAHLTVIMLAGPKRGRWRVASHLAMSAVWTLLATCAPLRAVRARSRWLARQSSRILSRDRGADTRQ